MQAIEANRDSLPKTAPPLDAMLPDTTAVRRHVTGVFRFLRALGANRELADDLTQDAFAVAWQKGKQSLPSAALAAFLRRTARFLWLAHCRSQRRAEAAIAAVAENIWARDCAEDDGEAWLSATRACVEQLRGRAARAVAMSYGEERSREAIARELGMRPNGVRTLLARTRQWLAACINGRNA
ncbi:MAG TPA: RNA polymerase sigma factor [Planctomycetota bacterium]|nr:RNA polymerase sigma factor [Planctomycetota bacterium]